MGGWKEGHSFPEKNIFCSLINRESPRFLEEEEIKFWDTGDKPKQENFGGPLASSVGPLAT